MLRALLEVTLKMVPLKAQMLQPLSGQTRSHSMCRAFGKDLEGESYHSIPFIKSGTVLIFVSIVLFVPQITHKS